MCGPGDGRYEPNVYTAAEPYDLTSGRYLNLHQCMFWSDFDLDHLTTAVGTTDVKFVAGTDVSDTRDTAVSCGGGGTDHPIPLLSSVTPLDLTAGRYLNLHQCMYYFDGYRDHLTTFGPSGDGRFNAGTNISNTPDTKPSCGRATGGTSSSRSSPASRPSSSTEARRLHHAREVGPAGFPCSFALAGRPVREDLGHLSGLRERQLGRATVIDVLEHHPVVPDQGLDQLLLAKADLLQLRLRLLHS
ncbi:hypothetical protein ACIG0C_24080 [Kitasatospora aureofaciens]|uniref:Uncharacterized protein n=1 Tax=Kitasatospora aureofaciens TaxID=1894 RepID=A0A1E7N948_KITAU|nr:hypothetical protein [Kitasatospora aureofaciens]OEV37217.1 hypothetical protein HS99_0005275 [Kitasatospora aureofaciens]GGU93441.1 hypothetical protein GCM10010502_53580 [Kitasatospora aureofaciens]